MYKNMNWKTSSYFSGSCNRGTRLILKGIAHVECLVEHIYVRDAIVVFKMVNSGAIQGFSENKDARVEHLVGSGLLQEGPV